MQTCYLGSLECREAQVHVMYKAYHSDFCHSDIDS